MAVPSDLYGLGWPTPEEAALASWAHTPNAEAKVVQVEPAASADAVYVSVQVGGARTGFHDLDIVTCQKGSDGRWRESGSTGGSSR
jgi:hypothetical protein